MGTPNSPSDRVGLPTNALRCRRNMVFREAERWRPPLFRPPTTFTARLVAALRRFFDLQAGSIWNDLSAELGAPHGVVLDVGCGAQPYRPLVNPNDTYVGIDIAAAKEHFGYEIPDTLYYDGEVWPVDAASADLVLCTETLEHVRNPDSFLAQAARATKPGGAILLTVPFSARWHFIPYDYWRFTPSSLRDLLERNGFTNVAVYARGNHFTVACYKVMALILPFLLPPGKNRLRELALRLVGFLFLPVLLLLAIVGQLTLLGGGGDDCLGYTAVATRC
jgi:SAM-dependent methyltransferase